MTIDISVIIAILSLVFSATVGVNSMKRNAKADNKKDASELTTVMVELKYISSGISDIKHEIGNVKDEVQELRDRVIAGEQSIKQAHKRLDEFGHRMDANHE